MRLKDISRFTRSANYRVDVSWKYLPSWIDDHVHDSGLDLNPDFQRNYIWTELQKTRYVEYALRGGLSGHDIYFNCVGWMGSFEGPFVLVDGKQRLNAGLGFLNNLVAVFDGNFYEDFEDKMSSMEPRFTIHINDLATRKEVLQWYLDLNSGGTIHTDDELNEVKELILKEK